MEVEGEDAEFATKTIEAYFRQEQEKEVGELVKVA